MTNTPPPLYVSTGEAARLIGAKEAFVRSLLGHPDGLRGIRNGRLFRVEMDSITEYRERQTVRR